MHGLVPQILPNTPKGPAFEPERGFLAWGVAPWPCALIFRAPLLRSSGKKALNRHPINGLSLPCAGLVQVQLILLQ